MNTAYIPLTRFWTEEDHLVVAEIQVESRPDEDHHTSADMTAIQVFSHGSGEPISGQAVLDPSQLTQLHQAIGRRLAELGHPDLAK